MLAVPIDQDEVAGTHDLAEPDAVALEPETLAVGIAQRNMAQRHVAVAFHLENTAGARELVQGLAQLGGKLAHASAPSNGGMRAAS